MKHFNLIMAGLIFLIGAALPVAAATIFMSVVPNYTVQTGSMEPTLPIGTYVFNQAPTHLRQGDIITFQVKGSSMPTTHTFQGYASDGTILTKGDANPTFDHWLTPVTRHDVLGKEWFVITPDRFVWLGVIYVAFVLVWMTLTIMVSARPKRLDKNPQPLVVAPSPV